jgi:plasmid stabilization system protein ParE
MTRLVTTPRFRSDTREILEYLERVAGAFVAENYNRRFHRLIEQLIQFPQSGAPRPLFGPDTRIGVVSPYVLFYDYRQQDDTVVLLRVLHGKRDISRELAAR